MSLGFALTVNDLLHWFGNTCIRGYPDGFERVPSHFLPVLRGDTPGHHTKNVEKLLSDICHLTQLFRINNESSGVKKSFFSLHPNIYP